MKILGRKTLIFPAGSAIMFSSGEYSDYFINGAVVTMKKVNIAELSKKFSEEEKCPDGFLHIPDFVGWLIKNEYAFPAELAEVHLGAYGRLNISRYQ